MSRAPGIAAGGETAAWFAGMLERQPEPVILTVLDGRTRTPLEGVRIHRPRAWLPEHIYWRQGIPVTSPADTLLDLAASVAPEELEVACAMALRKHLVSRTELQRRIDESAGRPGIAALRVAARAPQLTRSHYERELRRLVGLAELPPYEPNAVIYGKEIDLYWPEAKLGIEVDAFGTHGDRDSFEDDRKLDSDFAAADLEIRRFTGHRIMNHPHAVVARIAAILTRRLGGLPPPRRR